MLHKSFSHSLSNLGVGDKCKLSCVILFYFFFLPDFQFLLLILCYKCTLFCYFQVGSVSASYFLPALISRNFFFFKCCFQSYWSRAVWFLFIKRMFYKICSYTPIFLWFDFWFFSSSTVSDTFGKDFMSEWKAISLFFN